MKATLIGKAGALMGSGVRNHGAPFVRYVILGILNTILDFLIYVLLTRGWTFWQDHYLWANFISFVVVVTTSFIGNKYWTFEEHSRQYHIQYIKFLMITVVGLGIYQGVLYGGVHFLHLIDLVAKLIAAPTMAIWNFSMHRIWTFRPSTYGSPT